MKTNLSGEAPEVADAQVVEVLTDDELKQVAGAIIMGVLIDQTG